MVEHLNLRRPTFARTSYGGHSGRNLANFTRKRTDMADALHQAAGL